jgi:hypothetical protein
MILDLWIEDRKENKKKKALENISDTPKQVND